MSVSWKQKWLRHNSRSKTTKETGHAMLDSWLDSGFKTAIQDIIGKTGEIWLWIQIQWYYYVNGKFPQYDHCTVVG